MCVCVWWNLKFEKEQMIIDEPVLLLKPTHTRILSWNGLLLPD